MTTGASRASGWDQRGKHPQGCDCHNGMAHAAPTDVWIKGNAVWCAECIDWTMVGGACPHWRPLNGTPAKPEEGQS